MRAKRKDQYQKPHRVSLMTPCRGLILVLVSWKAQGESEVLALLKSLSVEGFLS